MRWYFRIGLSTAIGMFLATGFALSLSHVSPREAVLYQGLFPPVQSIGTVNVGDIFVISDFAVREVTLSQDECRRLMSSSEQSSKPRAIQVEVRSVLAERYGWISTLVPSFSGTQIDIASNTISAPDVVAKLATVKLPDESTCEDLVAQEAAGDCIVIVTNVQRHDGSEQAGEALGFSFPRGCQLIGFDLNGDAWSAPNVSFDSAFEVSRFERLWIELTKPLMSIEERAAKLD